VIWLQHAVGCGHVCVEHTPVAGDASTVPAGHAAPAATTLHTPLVVLQHALGPHGFGEHVVPSPWYMPPGKKFAQMPDPTMAQVVSIELQHAPAHGSGEQVVPGPRKALPQIWGIETTHVPGPMQQEPPTAGHGSGEHVVPAPTNTPGVPAHVTDAVMLHVRGRPVQHAP
jgi:hypothetical protein